MTNQQVTIIGDGQLARMMQPAAIELGVHLKLLAGAADSSAAQVIPDVVIGDYTELADLRAAANGADALTFDHEHVPNAHLDGLIAEGFNVQPQPASLIYAQDKLKMRQKLAALDLPVPQFRAITSPADATEFFHDCAGRVCLKARRGGYDGHGVWFPESEAELTELVEKLLDEGVELLAEKKISFTRELSALVARTPSGEVRCWPVAESVQADGICVEAIAPAPSMDESTQQHIQELARTVAEKLEVTGVLAVELFEFAGTGGTPTVAINELAMRPHNTGHWTQDGCVTSQFEQHLRAVLDLPLGSTEALAPVTVMVNTLGPNREPSTPMAERIAEVTRRYPRTKIHLYGKSYRAGRKLGHVNLTGDTVEETRAAARDAAHFLTTGQWLDQEERDF